MRCTVVQLAGYSQTSCSPHWYKLVSSLVGSEMFLQVLLPCSPCCVSKGVKTVLLHSSSNAYYRNMTTGLCVSVTTVNGSWARISCFAIGRRMQLKAGVWLSHTGNCSAPAEVLGERRPPASVRWQELNHLEELWTWPAAETEWTH